VGINLDRRYLAAIALILLVAFAGGIKYQSYNESRRQEEQLLLEELNLPKSALEEQEQEEESLIQVYVYGEDVDNAGFLIHLILTGLYVFLSSQQHTQK
jgi:hypothetical protein